MGKRSRRETPSLFLNVQRGRRVEKNRSAHTETLPIVSAEKPIFSDHRPIPPPEKLGDDYLRMQMEIYGPMPEVEFGPKNGGDQQRSKTMNDQFPTLYENHNCR